MQGHVEGTVFLAMFLSLLSNNGALAFLWDKEVAVVNSRWASFPVAVRHVEYIGVRDNGTLDCFTPGFREYEWRLFEKSAAGFYAESSELVTRLKIRKHHSRVNIGNDNFDLNGDMLVATCSPLLDHRPKLRIIWVITRLHSPLGYPTDPRVCDFGAKSSARGCHWYKRHYSTECYYGVGNDYLGHEQFWGDKNDEECLYWGHAWARQGLLWFGLQKHRKKVIAGDDHNFCRRMGGDGRFKPWCYANGRKPSVKPCKISECSDCIYGDGNGGFSLYAKRRFPTYQGRDVFVVERNKKGEHMQCVAGQTCRRIRNGRPSCQVKEEHGGKKTMECLLRQCTVRMVWFLFFDTFGRSYVDQSNVEPVEITLVDGKRNQQVQFGAFGIHLTSGLTVGTDNRQLVKYVSNIRVVGKLPPGALSRLVFKRASKELSGVYYVQYQFEEANRKIQSGTHRAKFKVTIKAPMRLSLKPPYLKVCHGQPGTFRLHISGFFDVLEGSIRWKYGISSRKMARIPLDDSNFQLSNNFLSVTVKKVMKNLVIGAEGQAYSGKTSTKARIEIKGEACDMLPLSEFPIPPLLNI